MKEVKQKTVMTFKDFREFNNSLNKLKREARKVKDSDELATIHKQIDILTKTLKKR
ncbi:hypothetical protein [Pseudoalteromonas sp. BSi20495]|uniref:hypothetical protein n=1 Tax=Pseudoalteromonas sp. BSi20495 TaxID=386429 RepID=UPI00023159B8|nr:hypothetical protein [Pseudoalteromonas sp. BSi20495]GAA78183.1 hypothetical protein P20495_0674 [Pseudoalteromonas sp. BSi20495]